MLNKSGVYLHVYIYFCNYHNADYIEKKVQTGIIKIKK